LKIIEKVQISKLGEIETIQEGQKADCIFSNSNKYRCNVGRWNRSVETVQHDSFTAPIKQQEENRGLNSTTMCTRMCKITKKTFKPWELSNLLIPQF
jgi:hypothetical protein